ncbi:MAG: TonB-dependent receptor plug domain-containing protein [Putridiphycobacter sp.]
MTFFKKIYFLCALAITTFGSVKAQDTLTGFEKLLETPVVSGSKKQEAQSEAPANIIVVTKDQIKNKGYRTLLEVMKDVQGFDFNIDEVSGEYPAHFLFRGIGGVGQQKYVILIDGIPQNDISNGWVRNIGFNFVLTDVERIEFVSGPGSSLYGLNAYTGFVNIITSNYVEKMEKNQVAVKAKMVYGSYQTYNPELQVIYKTKKGLAIDLNGRYYQSEGDYGLNRLDPGNYFHNNSEPDSVLTLTQGVIANETPNKPLPDGFNTNINDYYFRGKIQEDKMTLSFNFWEKNEGLGSEVVGYEYFANSPGIDYKVRHKGKSMNLAYKYELSENIKARSRIYFSNTSILPDTRFLYTYQFQSVENGVDSATTDIYKKYRSQGFLFGTDHQILTQIAPSNKLMLGFQFEQKIRQYFEIHLEESFTDLPTNSGLEVNPVYFSSNGAFLIQDEQKIGENYKMVLGVRYDFDQFFGQVFNPRFSFIRKTKKGFGFKYLYSQGFRAPTIFELYDEWRGNSDLTPEKIASNELQLSYKIPKKAIFKINAFHYLLQNLISLQPNIDGVIPIGPNDEHLNYYVNSGESQIYGVGASAIYQVIHQLHFNLNYQYLNNIKNTGIDNVAAHKVNFSINYLLLNTFNFNLRMNWVGRTKAPLTNYYFQPKTAETINQVGYDYVTEKNPDGYTDPIFLLHANIRTENLLKSNRYKLEAHLLVKNVLNHQYFYIGRQAGDGVRPIDAIQPLVSNPLGFGPAYHPQMGRQFYLGLTFKFN